jgi:hypothetical protein
VSDSHTDMRAVGYNNDECICRALTQNSPQEWNQRKGMSASSYDSSTVPTCDAACGVSGTLFGFMLQSSHVQKDSSRGHSVPQDGNFP